MRTTTRIFLAVVVLVAVAGCGKAEPRRHYEKSGGFSYDPPPGWTVDEFPGLKYRISHGTPVDGFAPNINIVEESFGGALEEYVDGNLKTLRTMFADIVIVRREKFDTADSQPAVRVVATDTQMGRRLRQTFCFFSNGSRKYVVTCSALADRGAELDAAFDSAMRSFRFH